MYPHDSIVSMLKPARGLLSQTLGIEYESTMCDVTTPMISVVCFGDPNSAYLKTSGRRASSFELGLDL